MYNIFIHSQKDNNLYDFSIINYHIWKLTTGRVGIITHVIYDMFYISAATIFIHTRINITCTILEAECLNFRYNMFFFLWMIAQKRRRKEKEQSYYLSNEWCNQIKMSWLDFCLWDKEGDSLTKNISKNVLKCTERYMRL